MRTHILGDPKRPNLVFELVTLATTVAVAACVPGATPTLVVGTNVIVEVEPTLVQSHPENASTPTLAGKAPVLVKCVTENDALSESILAGAIVLRGSSELLTWDIESRQLLPVPNAVGSPSASVSLDRKTLAFLRADYDANGNPVNPELWLQTADGNPVIEPVSWDRQWGALLGWLNNDQLLVTALDYEKGTRVALSPFSMEQRVLLPKFPNPFFETEEHADPSPNWEVVYDPSLTRVAYLQLANAEGFPAVVLWDINENKELWSLGHPRAQNIFAIPVWSDEGNTLAVAGQPSIRLDDLVANPNLVSASHFEIFLVSRTGQGVGVTNYSEYYSQVDISRLSWSPDSRHLAFWLQLNQSGNVHLATFEIATGITTNYCIESDGLSPQPVWSPNSEQLLLVSYDGERRWLVILDILRDKLVQIPESIQNELNPNLEPIGWMTTSP